MLYFANLSILSRIKIPSKFTLATDVIVFLGALTNLNFNELQLYHIH